MVKSNFRNSKEYKRIIEILDAYWISEPDEALVEVNMKFLHINGESQGKHISWENPKFNHSEIENAKENAWAFSNERRPNNETV